MELSFVERIKDKYERVKVACHAKDNDDGF
jgi:hypothetical protein